MYNVCCFTGHRDIPKTELKTIIRNMKMTMFELYQSGVDTYVTGGALGFDTLAALTVLEMKAKFPTVRLRLVLPCREQTKYWQQKDIDVYESIKQKADQVNYISERYTKECMFERNRYMVNHSQFVIAYCKRENGGTAYTVNYAKKHGRTVFFVS